MKTDKLWIIAVISNPVRYSSRYELYKAFENRVLAAGANLLTVEMAFGERDHAVTNSANTRHVQVRGADEVWVKENLVNIGLSRLPEDCKYVAWIDADISFVRPDWVEEIVQQLQHYQVIQPWQDAIDLGPGGEVLEKHSSFCWAYLHGLPEKQGNGYTFWHPGFAWAARREALDKVGGLLDTAILGAADHHMAWGLLGDSLGHTPGYITDGYKRSLTQWENKAAALHKDIGYMSGTIMHYWHGRKKDRHYQERWEIIKKWSFDPEQDLVRAANGVLHLTAKGERMRSDLRGYFRARQEDSIDL
jgi:hypothetical protein